ncbi:hypothetical protein CTI14_42905, partial [Methylobacterium radiotolerans]
MALIDAHVIFNDVSASNIVVGFNAEGREGLYLVSTSPRPRAKERTWAMCVMARIFGLVLTSKGLGLVVERIVDAHGNLAPTLKEVVARHGFSPELRHRVHDFIMALIDAHVIFNDVSASNIVVGFNAEGREGLYLV